MSALSKWWRSLARWPRGERSQPPVPAGPEESEKPVKLSPQDLYSAARRRLNWQAEWLQHLTPLHLAAYGEVPKTDRIARRLRVQTANLCVLFTADWTKKTPLGDGYMATYAGSRREAQILLAKPENCTLQVPTGSVEALIDLVKWAYGSDIGGDRLSLVQNTVARTLQDSLKPEDGYQSLLLRAPSILGEVKTQWKFFLEGKVEEFMEQIQALETEVSSTVQAFTERTAAMIKSLSETVLGAVGVLIGSFIAALVKGDTELPVIYIGVGAYLLYLLLFPLLFNMSHHRQTYKTLSEQFELRRRRFEERLYKDKVDEIVGDRVRKSRRRFWTWFFVTFFAYLVVAVGVLTIVRSVEPYF